MVADNPNVQIPPPKGSIQELVSQQLAIAERKAWLALAQYRFLTFGHHAAQWILLKSLLPFHTRNPFAPLVRVAKDMVAKAGHEEKGGEDAG